MFFCDKYWSPPEGVHMLEETLLAESQKEPSDKPESWYPMENCSSLGARKSRCELSQDTCHKGMLIFYMIDQEHPGYGQK